MNKGPKFYGVSHMTQGDRVIIHEFCELPKSVDTFVQGHELSYVGNGLAVSKANRTWNIAKIEFRKSVCGGLKWVEDLETKNLPSID